MYNTYWGFDTQVFTRWLQDFLPTAKVYRNRELYFVVFKLLCDPLSPKAKFLHENFFYSRDGKNFWQFKTTAQGEADGSYHATLQSLEGVVDVFYENNAITWMPRRSAMVPSNVTNTNEWLLWRHLLPSEAKLSWAVFHTIPEVRYMWLGLKFPSGEFIIIDAPTHNDMTLNYRLFYGSANSMRQLAFFYAKAMSEFSGMAFFHHG